MSSIDLSLLQTVQHWISPWLTGVMKVISALLTPEIVLPICFIVLLVLLIKHKRFQEVLLITILAGNIFTLALKPVFHRPRPTGDVAVIIDHQGNYSMPSGHAVAAMTIGGAIILLAHHRQRASRWLVAGVTVGIFLVGLSRVYLGAHWPSDVLVGYGVGFLWVIFVQRFLRPHLERWHFLITKPTR